MMTQTGQSWLDIWEEHVNEKAALRAEIERLRAALFSISRRTASSTRTFDDSIRDMELANDLARAALEPTPGKKTG